MENIIIIAVIAVIVALAAWYVIRAKKNGRKCVGCPVGCPSKKDGITCRCNCDTK